MSSDQFLRNYSEIKSPLENSINLNPDMSYEQFLRSYTGFKSLLENSIYFNPDLSCQEEEENNKIDNSNHLTGRDTFLNKRQSYWFHNIVLNIRVTGDNDVLRPKV